MTADVLDSLGLSKGQTCVLRMAILKLQRRELEIQHPTQSAPSQPLDAAADALDATIDDMEAKLLREDPPDELAAGTSRDQQKKADGKPLISLRPHEALYIKPKRRPDGKEIKVQPTDLTYQEFLAGSLIILERMFRDSSHAKEAMDFCLYLKFVTQKATNFRAQGSGSAGV